MYSVLLTPFDTLVPTCEVKSVEWPKVMNVDKISEFV